MSIFSYTSTQGMMKKTPIYDGYRNDDDDDHDGDDDDCEDVGLGDDDDC